MRGIQSIGYAAFLSHPTQNSCVEPLRRRLPPLTGDQSLSLNLLLCLFDVDLALVKSMCG